MAQNPLQILDSQNFNYGTTPKDPVAEQNQTYIAYFDGVGGTGPEYIDGTAYFIKYLIDVNGNVVNPEPTDTADNPQSIALYNLINKFSDCSYRLLCLLSFINAFIQLKEQNIPSVEK